MHVVSYKKIRDFCEIHPRAATSHNHWYQIVRHEKFKNFSEIRQLFPSADQVGNFVVFNIGGNNYRLIAFVRYRLKKIFIRHILTHREYDQEKWQEDSWF